MKSPRLYLVLDNCFAIKRWIKPSEWMGLTKEIGFNYAQASTDNEIDPLFSPEDYMDDWFEEVKRCEKETGVKAVNFYTGYQTYRTVGFAHHDQRVRRKLLDGWLKPIIKRIDDLKAAGIGFSYFAIPDEALQDPIKYKQRTEIIVDILGEISEYAYENGGIQVSFEQMYAPHQPPWTIEGSCRYLKDVFAIHKKPVYVTLDVGHMVGQKRFLKPSFQDIEASLAGSLKNGDSSSKSGKNEDSSSKNGSSIWLGADSTYKIWAEAVKGCNTSEELKNAAEAIVADMETYPHLFAQEKDGDIYEWVEELSRYSPIIHMQQTNGVHSSHAAFTPQTNRDGIVTGERLLQAIARSYDKQIDSSMPPPVDDIYLSFEIFASNIETKSEIINKLVQTLAYWRKFVPEDGMLLKDIWWSYGK